MLLLCCYAAEYLTPKLKHVTNVGGARFTAAGDLVGGGIKPDIYCETKGIPRNAGGKYESFSCNSLS